MLNFGKTIVKHRRLVLLISIVLLIPSVLGYVSTRVNYDVLSYLPSDIDTMKGQNILTDEFHKGAFAFYMVDGMNTQDLANLKKKIEKVDGVDSVVWYDSIADTSIPMSVLPQKVYDAFNSDDTTMMAIFFDSTTSDDSTLEAISQIRDISSEQCFLSGMSSVVVDTKELTEQEEPTYVAIAVILSSIVLALFMDSFLVPVIFLASIGMAIIYNLGTNVFLGEVSFITKALAAILQLAVTMDYSIFLWHSYKEMEGKYGDREEAMAHAIKNTIVSVAGSSLTTIAGFLALCFMSFQLGMNLGIVMAKGVLFGVVACITILPAMILVFDKALDKTHHRSLMPDKFDHYAHFIVKHFWIFLIIFGVLMFPAVYGSNNNKVYYNLAGTLPGSLPSIKANNKLEKAFNLNSTHMVLVNADLSKKDVKAMADEMEKVSGVKEVLGMNTLVGSAFPNEMIPSQISDMLVSDNHQLILINSKYKVASDAVNAQINDLNKIVKKYDSKGMVIGEAPCTKDLIEITNTDFNMVNTMSIAMIFLIILILLRSVTLPVVLVAIIEGAIFVNMAVPYYTGVSIPFIASIVIGTIQLGSTVDYAILMTTRFRKERRRGNDKKTAIEIALSTSMPSVIVSAVGFFAATYGVALYSNIDMISSLCRLLSRGALISMVMVLTVLPSAFMVFDKLINRKIIKQLKTQGGKA